MIHAIITIIITTILSTAAVIIAIRIRRRAHEIGIGTIAGNRRKERKGATQPRGHDHWRCEISGRMMIAIEMMVVVVEVLVVGRGRGWRQKVRRR